MPVTTQGIIAAVECAAANFTADLMKAKTFRDYEVAIMDVAREMGIQRSAWWVVDRNEESALFEAAVRDLDDLAEHFAGDPAINFTPTDRVRILSARGIVNGLVEAAQFHKREG